MKPSTLVAAGVVICCTLSGCANKEKQLAGKWHFTEMAVTSTQISPSDIAVAESRMQGSTIDFKADHTFTMSLGGIPMTGDWTLSSQGVTLTTQTIGGQSIDKIQKQFANMAKTNPGVAKADPTGARTGTLSDDGKTLSVGGSVNFEKDSS